MPVPLLPALAIGSAVAGLAGTAVGVAGQLNSAKAAKEDAYYQAQVAANNAVIADQNANWTNQAGSVQEFNKGLQTRGIIGQEKATQGASGIDVNTGSAAKVRTATQELGQTDVATIASDTAKKAYGFKVQAQSDTAQGQLDIQKGQNASQAGQIGALGSFLSGISSTASAASRYGIQSNSTPGSQVVGAAQTGDPMYLQGSVP